MRVPEQLLSLLFPPKTFIFLKEAEHPFLKRRNTMAINKLQAVAYLRTSLATNVDGDSHARQLAAIEAYAKSANVEIVAVYTDDAVKGADAIDNRPGFNAMMERLLSNGVRTIICESASRFARD